MAVNFTIDIKRISKSKLIFDTLLSFLGTDNKAEAVATFFTLGPTKTLEKIREATRPTHVRFYNPDPATEVCQGLNGNVWPVDSGSIRRPPIHWSCKSALVYFRK